MKTSILPLLLVLYPFLGGTACAAVGRKNETHRDYLADFVVISEFMLLLFALHGADAAVGTAVTCYVP